MKSTNTNGPRNTNGTAMCTAQPASKTARPTYIGLRVYRYMPLVTMEDTASIFTGLMVVLARRNANTPSAATRIPRPARQYAVTRRKGLSPSRRGDQRAAAHMAVPISNATIGGGTLFSSAFMKLLRSNWVIIAGKHASGSPQCDS